MDTKNLLLATGAQVHVLPILIDMAKFKSKSKDDDRGGFFFSDKPGLLL